MLALRPEFCLSSYATYGAIPCREGRRRLVGFDGGDGGVAQPAPPTGLAIASRLTSPFAASWSRRQSLDRRIYMESLNTSRVSTSPQQQRLLALNRANRIRTARSALKRRLHAGQITPAEAILRGSRDTDTMTVDELLRSQRGWGPKRSLQVLRSVLLSDTKTLGSLTERQRIALAGVLSSPGHKKRSPLDVGDPHRST